MRVDQIQAALDSLMTMFREQTFPEQIALQIIRRRQGDDRPCDHWSLMNQLLMLSAGTQDARGYRQWQQAGRQVKPGSRALFILAPMLKPVRQREKNAETEADPVSRIVGFRTVPVFRVEDTSGAALPAATEITPPVLPPLYEVAAKLGLTVRYRPFDGRALGTFRPGAKEISLSETSPLTYLHELCHAADNSIEPILPGRLSEAELVAEMGGQILSTIYGFTGFEGSTYRYLQLYSREHDPQGVLRCLAKVTGRVEVIVSKILDLAEPNAKTSLVSPQALSA